MIPTHVQTFMKHPEQPLSPAVASGAVCALESILFDEWKHRIDPDSLRTHMSTHELHKLFLLEGGQSRSVAARLHPCGNTIRRIIRVMLTLLLWYRPKITNDVVDDLIRLSIFQEMGLSISLMITMDTRHIKYRIHSNKHALLGRWKFLYDLVCNKKLVAVLTSFVADTSFLAEHFPPSAMLRHADRMQATILAFEMCNGINFDDSAQSVNMPVASAPHRLVSHLRKFKHMRMLLK